MFGGGKELDNSKNPEDRLSRINKLETQKLSGKEIVLPALYCLEGCDWRGVGHFKLLVDVE